MLAAWEYFLQRPNDGIDGPFPACRAGAVQALDFTSNVGIVKVPDMLAKIGEVVMDLPGRAGSTVMPSTEARYERVMRLLRERIARGEYNAADGKLPSTAKLADEFGFSPGTIRQAITIMTALGELRGEPGVAVYVNRQETTDG